MGSLVGSLGSSCRYRRFLFCLDCPSRPRRKYFFITLHLFNYFVPIAQQAGQAAMLGRSSLSMCLWAKHAIKFKVLLPVKGSTSGIGAALADETNRWRLDAAAVPKGPVRSSALHLCRFGLASLVLARQGKGAATVYNGGLRNGCITKSCIQN
jgi:hypothetical protein